MIFMLRLSPLVPFNVFNYAMGLTGCKFWHYCLGGLGMVPIIVIDVYLGSVMSNIADAVTGNLEMGWINLVIMISGGVLAFLAAIFTTWIVK